MKYKEIIRKRIVGRVCPGKDLGWEDPGQDGFGSDDSRDQTVSQFANPDSLQHGIPNCYQIRRSDLLGDGAVTSQLHAAFEQ